MSLSGMISQGARTMPIAPGYRDSGNNRGYGALREVGGHGYSWAAAVAGTNARYLYFRTGGLFPQASTDRAYGLPLRCLQE